METLARMPVDLRFIPGSQFCDWCGGRNRAQNGGRFLRTPLSEEPDRRQLNKKSQPYEAVGILF